MHRKIIDQSMVIKIILTSVVNSGSYRCYHGQNSHTAIDCDRAEFLEIALKAGEFGWSGVGQSGGYMVLCKILESSSLEVSASSFF